MCRDPGLSPLDPKGWEETFDTQLRGYHALFVLGRTNTAKAARDALEELRAVLDNPEDAVLRAAPSSEEINGRLLLSGAQRSGADPAGLLAVSEFRTLHRVCDVPYPDEVKLGFSTQEIHQELDAFEIESSKIKNHSAGLKPTSQKDRDVDWSWTPGHFAGGMGHRRRFITVCGR